MEGVKNKPSLGKEGRSRGVPYHNGHALSVTWRGYTNILNNHTSNCHRDHHYNDTGDPTSKMTAARKMTGSVYAVATVRPPTESQTDLSVGGCDVVAATGLSHVSTTGMSKLSLDNSDWSGSVITARKGRLKLSWSVWAQPGCARESASLFEVRTGPQLSNV